MHEQDASGAAIIEMTGVDAGRAAALIARLPHIIRDAAERLRTRIGASAGRARPAIGGVLVFDGDSISVSLGVPSGSTMADQTATALPFTGKLAVVGEGGRPVKECDRLFPVLVAPLEQPGPKLIFFHAGDNDIGLGSDAATAYRSLVSYVDQAHRAGWKVVVSTELPRFDFPPHWQSELAAFNDLLRANSAGADGVVDFARDRIVGGPKNRTNPKYYQPDGVHPTAEGYRVLVPAVAAALRRALR